MAHSYWQRLRQINSDIDYASVRSKREKLKDERTSLIAETKKAIFDAMSPEDQEVFGSPENISLRIRSVRHENSLRKLLRAQFGIEDFKTADPTGELGRAIGKILSAQGDDDAKFAKIKELLEHWGK